MDLQQIQCTRNIHLTRSQLNKCPKLPMVVPANNTLYAKELVVTLGDRVRAGAGGGGGVVAPNVREKAL